MARTSTARNPQLAKVSGETTEIAYGQAGGDSTSTTVTIPQAKSIKSVVVTGTSTTTAMFVVTDSTNTFTVTHGNNEYFDWIAVVVAKM